MYDGNTVFSKLGETKAFEVDLKLTHLLENKAINKCQLGTNLPSCEIVGVRRLLEKIGWEGITPLWLTNNLSSVTTDESVLQKIKTNFSNINEAKTLFDIALGINKLDCLDPCDKVQVVTTHKHTVAIPKSDAFIYFYLPENIVEETEIPTNFDLVVMLSLIGGNMGLWMGLSVANGLLFMVNRLS